MPSSEDEIERGAKQVHRATRLKPGLDVDQTTVRVCTDTRVVELHFQIEILRKIPALAQGNGALSGNSLQDCVQPSIKASSKACRGGWQACQR